MNTKKMKYSYFFWLICAVLIISFGCGQNYEEVEINVPNSVKEAIEEAAPAGEYRFFALKESFPKNIEDMKQVKLLVCGEIGNQVDLKVIMASLGDQNSLLFKSIHRFFINPNVISGTMAMNENVSIKLDSGEIVKIPREKSIYGKDNSIDTLVSNCVKGMQKNKNSILLIKRSVDGEMFNQMVEIIFM